MFLIKLILPKDQAGKKDRAQSQGVMDSVCENTRCVKIGRSTEKFPVATQEGPCLNTLQGNALYLETTPWQKSYTNIELHIKLRLFFQVIEQRQAS